MDKRLKSDSITGIVFILKPKFGFDLGFPRIPKVV